MAEKTENIDTSTWVDDYADMLFNYAFTRVSDEELARDIVQDTFVSALKGLSSFKGNSTIKTWLFSILKRKIIDHWRKQDSRKTKPMSSLGADGEDKSNAIIDGQNKGSISEIEIDYNNMELRNAILGCIHDLPEKWKGIVIDKLVEEQDTEDVCNEHNITPSNLWVIIHRAKAQLRNCLEVKWFNS